MIKPWELPPVEYKVTNLVPVGDTADIIENIHLSLDDAVKQVKPFAERFRGKTVEETARNILSFLKTQIAYRREPKGEQDAKHTKVQTTLGGVGTTLSPFVAAHLKDTKHTQLFW